jgi:hypothetical protein
MDSYGDTMKHIGRVREILSIVAERLKNRGVGHDRSKLESPEKDVLDEFTPKLAGSEYGGEEYKGFLKAMKPALDHHYAESPHHPEHYPNGINDMTLIDLVEMMADWAAASERHQSGSVARSVEVNRKRFGLTDQLATIFLNTYRELGLLPKPNDAGAQVKE